MLIQELDLPPRHHCTLYLRSLICLLNASLMETICSSLCVSPLSKNPGRFKNQARAKPSNFGVGAVSHILNPFQISPEFERKTLFLTLVQSPILHQLSPVVLQGAALAGIRGVRALHRCCFSYKE